jgi:hypothetical protein
MYYYGHSKTQLDMAFKWGNCFGYRVFNLCVVRELGEYALIIMGEPQKNNSNPNTKMIIVGINLLVLIAYTIYWRVFNNEELIILVEAIFIAFQVAFCLIMAIFVYRKELLLSALVVLLIGFSSCWIVFT